MGGLVAKPCSFAVGVREPGRGPPSHRGPPIGFVATRSDHSWKGRIMGIFGRRQTVTDVQPVAAGPDRFAARSATAAATPDPAVRAVDGPPAQPDRFLRAARHGHHRPRVLRRRGDDLPQHLHRPGVRREPPHDGRSHHPGHDPIRRTPTGPPRLGRGRVLLRAGRFRRDDHPRPPGLGPGRQPAARGGRQPGEQKGPPAVRHLRDPLLPSPTPTAGAHSDRARPTDARP